VAVDAASIIPSAGGADAVLTALGPHGTGPTTISQDSVHSIILAMQKTGTRRLITVSGSIVLRATFLRYVCADVRDAEAAVRDGGLDWTIMRPRALTNKPARGTYRTAD